MVSPERLLRLHLLGEYVPNFTTVFSGFRIRRLHKLYCLSGIYFVTIILFELCNYTRMALKTQGPGGGGGTLIDHFMRSLYLYTVNSTQLYTS